MKYKYKTEKENTYIKKESEKQTKDLKMESEYRYENKTLNMIGTLQTKYWSLILNLISSIMLNKTK